MPLFLKAAFIFVVTIAALLLSPLTLAVGVWVANAALPLAGLIMVTCGIALITSRVRASKRFLR